MILLVRWKIEFHLCTQKKRERLRKKKTITQFKIRQTFGERFFTVLVLIINQLFCLNKYKINNK